VDGGAEAPEDGSIRLVESGQKPFDRAAIVTLTEVNTKMSAATDSRRGAWVQTCSSSDFIFASIVDSHAIDTKKDAALPPPAVTVHHLGQHNAHGVRIVVHFPIGTTPRFTTRVLICQAGAERYDPSEGIDPDSSANEVVT